MLQVKVDHEMLYIARESNFSSIPLYKPFNVNGNETHRGDFCLTYRHNRCALARARRSYNLNKIVQYSEADKVFPDSM